MNDYDETCPCCDMYLRDGHADGCELMGAYEALEKAQKERDDLYKALTLIEIVNRNQLVKERDELVKERDEARKAAELWRDVVNLRAQPCLKSWGVLPWENDGRREEKTSDE